MVDTSSPDVKLSSGADADSSSSSEADVTSNSSVGLKPRHEEQFALGHLSIEDEDSNAAGASALVTPAVPAPVRQSAEDSGVVSVGGHAAEELHLVSPQTIEAKVGAGQELLQSLDAIPDKMAFKIGEAAEMVGVKQYVLRYWESEFEMLRPRKSKNNQRVYSRRDVETAMMIKKLLYEDRFSIEGARAALKQLKSQVKEEKSIKALALTQESAVTKLRTIAAEIRRIRAIFS